MHCFYYYLYTVNIKSPSQGDNRTKKITDMGKKTKEQKEKETRAYLEYLKTLPPEKLSKWAKTWIAKGYEKPVEMDMKAVMK